MINKRKGLGPEDKIHVNFGQLVQQYDFYRKLKNCPFWSYQPFGEQRSKLTGGLLKKKGTKKGVPDYLFIKDNKGTAEMVWLEFKAEKGKQSVEQFDFEVNCQHLKNMSYYLPRSVEEGLNALRQEGILIE